MPVTATGWTGQPLRILELAGLNTADPPRPAADEPESFRPAPAAGSAVAAERAERLTRLRQGVGQLRTAIASRPVIDQARGVLMAVHACTSQQAWDILRETSQRSSTKLRTVADVVTAGALPDGPAPPEEVRAALRTAVAARRCTAGPVQAAHTPPGTRKPEGTGIPGARTYPQARAGRAHGRTREPEGTGVPGSTGGPGSPGAGRIRQPGARAEEGYAGAPGAHGVPGYSVLPSDQPRPQEPPP